MADRNAVTAREPLLAQPAGHARGAVPEIAVGDTRAVELHDGVPIGCRIDRCAQHLHERARQVVEAFDAIGTAIHAAHVERLDDLGHQ